MIKLELISVTIISPTVEPVKTAATERVVVEIELGTIITHAVNTPTELAVPTPKEVGAVSESHNKGTEAPVVAVVMVTDVPAVAPTQPTLTR